MPFPNDEYEVEDTHAVMDRCGYDVYSTPCDRLMSDEGMGFAYAEAMNGEE